eukprot:SAG22_NODE_3055_length_1981_cov_1.324655_2_plen_154_part_00
MFCPLRCSASQIRPELLTSECCAADSSLSVSVAPIRCNEDHSFANPVGSACICEQGYYRRAFGGGWSCERCGRGEAPSLEGTRCDKCTYGKYSPDGEECSVCPAGYEPNHRVSADSCQSCDESSTSTGEFNPTSRPRFAKIVKIVSKPLLDGA